MNTLKKLIVFHACLMIAQLSFSENTSEIMKNDSIKISINEVRTANKIFMEHEYLKKTLRLEEKENKHLRQMVSHYARVDSLSTIRIKTETGLSERYKKKAERRLKWLVPSLLVNAILLGLLFI